MFPPSRNLDFNCNHVEFLEMRDHRCGVAFHPHSGIRKSITLSNYPNYSSTHQRLFCPNQLGANQVTPYCLSEIRGVFVSTCAGHFIIHSLRRRPLVTRPKFSDVMCFRRQWACRNFCTLCDFHSAGSNHDTNLSHFPGPNRCHRLGNHPS